jgi:hypothetical protein
MKKIVLAAAFLILAGTGTAQAQWFAEGPSSSTGVSSISTGRIARNWPPGLPKRYGVAIQKNDGSFVPSSFLEYADAVKLGESDSNSAAPSVAEIARLDRERKKAETGNTHVVFEQDGKGKILPNRAEP